ncbi:unnamed protein product [Penicillium roqueforti FM164]|uniref:Genomic scaffold, ProqFM164S01 n=1 Tax=Penicillium roqueforti (strain FM164) TaxID=1365484 RepID=W6Q3S7_PENRF|nr:unnamed protein product [Penicillium roqueforti FM164]
MKSAGGKVRVKSAVTFQSNACPQMDYCPKAWQFIMREYTWARIKRHMYITKSTDSQLVPLNGSFYQHPDFPPDNTSGFVTITGETPPTLRWVYVDLQTHELRWGGKQDSEGNICGPFDWTQDEERITLEGWEGWLAVRVPDDEKISEVVGVENSQDLWRLYFDNNDDGADLPQDAEVLEVTIKRTAAES